MESSLSFLLRCWPTRDRYQHHTIVPVQNFTDSVVQKKLNKLQVSLDILIWMCYNTNVRIFRTVSAGVLELADEVDSKSIASDGVRVQVPPPA